MIFVTVGTQLPFDRLLRGVDAWAAEHPDEEIVAQTGRIGPQNYAPQHMVCEPTMDPDDFDRFCRKARLLVAHAGTGSLLKAHAFGTPVLMMPRKASLGEHRNDHQIATAENFRKKPGVNLVYEESALPEKIDALLSQPPQPPVLPALADDTLIATLRDVIFPNG